MFNKHLHFIFIITLISLFLSSCSKKQTKKQLSKDIAKYESELQINANNFSFKQANKAKAQKLLSLFKTFIREYPSSPQTPNYLFNAAMLEAEPLKNYKGSNSLLKKLRKKYSQDKRSAKALFLIGYNYDEKLKDYTKAKIVFDKFLKQYPHNQLVASVKFELKYLGTSTNHIPIGKQK